ncbi:MAG: SDR family NAD(P)-dependent oxidoreductase [Planctomycetota bacterium]
MDFEKLKLRLPLKMEDWHGDAGQRLAGINGFGYGGANAHVILQEAPVLASSASLAVSGKNISDESSDATVVKPESQPVLLPVSARNKTALAQVASQFADWVDDESHELSLSEIAGYTAFRRSHQEVRATVSGTSKAQWSQQLREIAASPENHVQSRLTADQIHKGILFVFSGQGPQWWAMGRGLYRNNDVFRESIGRCDREFAKYVSWSLVEELFRDESDTRLNETSIAQPSIFALQVSLAAVWESWGIRPGAIVGHSVGEIAGACLSGALSWQDACCVAVHRGRTMDLASSRGAMIAAGLSPEEARQWIAGIEDHVSLAAINGPTSVTISGADRVIEDLAERIEAAGIFCRRLRVEYAFHSPQMEPVREELLRSLAGVRAQAAHTPLISTVTGDRLSGQELEADYWWQNVRRSVRFADAMHVAANDGFGVALEVGPHPVLTMAITDCFQQDGTNVRVFPSLHRERQDSLCMSESLGGLYKVGVDLDWSKFCEWPSQRVTLPVYPFQHQRCWTESFESASTRIVEDYHPLLGESNHGPQPSWSSRVELKLQAYLNDHRVRDTCMLPAAAMIEIAGEAARQTRSGRSITLRRIQLHGACVLDPEKPLSVQTDYAPDRRLLQVAFRDVNESNWQPLMTAEVSDDIQSEVFDSAELLSARTTCDEPFYAADCYEYCEQIGLQYGERFRGIQDGVRSVNGEVVAQVELDSSLADEASEYAIHPALLDSCFHGMVVADPNYNRKVDGLFLPAELDEVRFLKPAGTKVTVHVRLVEKTRSRIVADVDVLDSSGQPCLLVRGFVSKRVGSVDAKLPVHDLIYRYAWLESETPASDADWCESLSERRYCIFTDQIGIGDRLCRQFETLGIEVVQVRRGMTYRQVEPRSFVIDPENQDHFATLFKTLGANNSITDIVYLWGLDAPETDSLDTKSLDQSTVLTTLTPLNIVSAWEQVDEFAKARMTIVTTGAQSPDGNVEPIAISQTPLIGFGRVIVSEYGRLESKLVDLPSVDRDSAVDCLVTELAIEGDDEDEVMYRDGKRWVHRFVQQYDQPVTQEAARTLPSSLQIGRSSGVEELRYRTVDESSLRPDEIEIQVLATGLNFSDVMKALDLYPGLPDGPVPLGAECSGRISRVGADVKDWNLGDDVIAVAPGSFATHVTVKSSLVAKKPSNLTHQQAAAVPIAFLTAHYALNECARMRSGDRVLIHSASGGVGLAAMQLAKTAGAEVYATAGNDEKRACVKALGAVEVMDSRSLAFAEQTLRATDGEGVDIILNSLPGEAIAKGLSILKTGGRFLEIGKRDIYADAPLGLHPFRNNLALFAIDLDQLFKQQPERMGKMLNEVAQRFEAGQLHPLPIKTYNADDTRSAYRLMQQGKHIGKIVVEYEQSPESVFPGTFQPIQFRGDATYWIAGGLGGFGLQIARWMADHGAGHLVLSGRSKNPSAEAQSVINEITAGGTGVTVMPADITKAEQVRNVLNAIDGGLPELRGVFHTAMVLEDRLLVDLDRDTLERVLRPKVLGGWNLHRETVDRRLDHFVLFSSLSSVFGHAGQANYSAANALLDGLAHYRRALGLQATVINWGHLGEVGYLAQREQLGERLERQGVLSFSVKQATESLEYALQTMALQLSVLRIDWSVWRGLGVSSRVSPRFAHLLKNRSTAMGNVELASAEEIHAAELPQRIELVGNILRSKAGMLLGIDGDEIECDRSLLELGLDSLMAVEMRNWVESQIKVNLPISSLMRSAGLDELTTMIAHAIGHDRVESVSPEERDVGDTDESISSERAEALLDELPELEDDQVSKLLSEMLRQQKGE